MQSYLDILADGDPLSRDEAEGAMRTIMSGEARDEHVAALLMGVRTRGETLDELVGFTSATTGTRPSACSGCRTQSHQRPSLASSSFARRT